MPNRLATESSPYLRQHADNPVEWLPWGAEAFAAARAADRPVLLSVGYAACHWCHVMAHESFADPAIAALMNAEFVCVKVDREEHPEVDALYQGLCQAVTGQGGWPLTAFLAPDLRPFYVGTYFPPRARYGRPGLTDVLGGLAQAWRHDRARVRAVAAEWGALIQRLHASGPGSADTPAGSEAPAAPPEAVAALLGQVDALHGGFGGAPKFPHAEALELLLQAGGAAAARAVFTLRAMAGGGIYDQIGGGFHRYSVDEAWQVPHFEKMLYDSALLAPVYLAAFQRTHAADLAQVARGTLDYLLRDLRLPEGGFASSEDADSPAADGGAAEGAFYTWTPAEVLRALGDGAEAETACRHLGITPEGNCAGGRSIPHLQALSLDQPQELGGPGTAQLAEILRRLREARAARPRPGRDEKVLAGWNGLAVSALARGGRILGDARYLEAARTTAHFLLCALRRDDGGLWRRWYAGRAGIPGTLEDYAYLAVGLLDLYEATLEPAWLGEAASLVRAAVERFWDGRAAAFYLTEAQTEAQTEAPSASPSGAADDLLIARPREDGDAGTPAAQSCALLALLRLQPYVRDPALAAIPAAVFARTAPLLRRHPLGVASLHQALALAVEGALEVVIAAPPGDPQAEAWLERLRARHLPRLSLSRIPDPARIPGLRETPPAWEGRGMHQGRPTLWVCRGHACLPPAHDWEGVAATLSAPG